MECKGNCLHCTHKKCKGLDHTNLLDLINHLKAEKEALINGQESLQKHIAKQNAEIEMLRNIDVQMEVSDKLEKEIKSEARKEFVEMLKKKKQTRYMSYKEINYTLECVEIKDINNLLEKMERQDYE